MKKSIGLFILLSVMSCAAVAQSQSIEKTDPGFVLLDVLIYRPVGLVATIVGTAVFVGVSPLTALASIPEPHDAFAKISNILILFPGTYTFVRPIGDRDFPYYASPYKHKQVAPQNNTAVPKPNPAIPAVPKVQSPHTPDTGKGL
ncbi:MAG: hypothetical protein WCS87_01790 [Methylococcaceae bacterium]